MRESATAVQAYRDYLTLEGRTLDKLARLYQSRPDPVPTRSLRTLKWWSEHYGWQARVQDAERERTRQAESAHALARREVFGRALGLDYERVRVLQDLAARLIQATRRLRLLDEERDDGTVITASSERRIAVLITQLRGVLADIAEEVGGRQAAPALRAALVDFARANAAAWGLDEAAAVDEAEQLLRDLKLV